MARTMATGKEEEMAEVFVKAQFQKILIRDMKD